MVNSSENSQITNIKKASFTFIERIFLKKSFNFSLNKINNIFKFIKNIKYPVIHKILSKELEISQFTVINQPKYNEINTNIVQNIITLLNGFAFKLSNFKKLKMLDIFLFNFLFFALIL